MSQPYVPGGSKIYVSTPGSQAMLFLGYCESEIRPQFTVAHEPIFADYGGPAVPVDSQMMGEYAVVPMDLIRYNENVLMALMRRSAVTGSAAGTGGSGSIGSLMLHENAAVRLVLISPYAATKSAYSSMVPCLNFGFAYAMGDVIMPMGIRVRRPRLVMGCYPVVDPATSGYTLYTTSVAGLTLPNPD